MGVVELPRKHFASFRFDSELSGYRRYRTLVAGCKSNSLFSLSLSLSLSVSLSLVIMAYHPHLMTRDDKKTRGTGVGGGKACDH